MTDFELFKLTDILNRSGNVVFLGGAGVSTDSGIPDFRGDGGTFGTLSGGEPPEVLLSHTFFIEHPDTFFKYYLKNLVHREALPNEAHYALAELEGMGVVSAVITQNIDRFHQRAGSSNVVELHGSVYRNYCMDCGKYYTLEYVMSDEARVPRCSLCNGIVRPDVVLYGEALRPKSINSAISFISNAETLIVGGTSLNVYPAAGLIEYFKGKDLVLINKTELSYDKRFELVIHDSIGCVLSEAVTRLKNR